MYKSLSMRLKRQQAATPMKRFFNLALGALAMLAVALTSAFIAMRLAIHGREVDVPALVGLTVDEAGRAAADKGLNLNLENRFYSTSIPAGHVLAQNPAPGSRVRSEWEVRITESLGPQRVQIPDLIGETERAAAFTIRRLALEQGAIAHLPLEGDPGVVLAQAPLSNSGGSDGPRVSLLLTEPEDTQPPAYVMPSLIGFSYAAANARASAMGLHLVVGEDLNPKDLPPNSEYSLALNQIHNEAQQQSLTQSQSNLLSLNPYPPPHTGVAGSGNILSQTPPPGRRVQKGETVHVTLGR
jgi:beta-lactam-binding protein with PASTA domain